MERDDTQIKHLIEKLILLLKNNKEEEWAATLKTLLEKFAIEEDRKNVAKEIIDIYRGGMGSFSDLILQKDMKMLIQENNELAKLKHELFNLCLQYGEQKLK